jgi:DNA-binding CsgD family transcriptional regulator/tetratricopeptide (TPR) repeat protein
MLARLLSQARSGRPAVAFLTGPPGIGKTRLLDELAHPGFAEAATVLRGSASQAEGMPPYLPFLEALGEYVSTAPVETLHAQLGTRAAILATLLPEIADRLGPPERLHPLAPEQERFRLFEGMALFLAAVAADNPLLLLLDDLQWADADSLELLTYVAGRMRSARMLVVGAYREGEAIDNPGLVRALAELNRRRLLVTIPLLRLERNESGVLAANLLGGEIAPEAVDLLYGQAEGNPFFIEELVRSLVEDRTLVPLDGRWSLRSHPARVLPPRVAEAIRSRLTRLDPGAVDLLRIAAVVGRSCEPGLLSHVSGVDVEEVEDLLLAAARRHLVQPDSVGGFAFTHDMVRETLYAEVGWERRRRLHQAIGVALLEQGGVESPRRLADLAFHFGQAGERTRGVMYALAAGDEALRASAVQEAMVHYGTAVRLLGNTDSTRHAEALTKLGEASTLGGFYPQAAEAFEAARDELLRMGDVAGAARASRRLGLVHWRQEAGLQAAAAFGQSLDLLGPGDSPDAATVLLELGDLLVTSLGRYTEGTSHAERALAMVERFGDGRLEARALCVIGNIRARSNELAVGLDALERALALARQLDEPAMAAEVCAYLANVSAWTGDVARSRELSLQRLALAERTHDPFELRHVYSWIGGLETLQGRWSEAERWFALQERALEGLQTPEPLAALRANQGVVHYYRGQLEEAERALAEAVAAVRPMGASQLIWYLGRLGLILAELRPEKALTCFAELHALADPLPAQSSPRLGAFAYLAVGYARLGERERAAVCYPSLLPFRGQFAPLPADRALGLAAAAAGDFGAAAAHLADAEVQTRGAGVHPELALILLERGLLEQDPGTVGGDRGRTPRVRPTGPLAEGLRLCEELGMRSLGRRIVGPVSPSPEARVAGLTVRELDVLRLVAEGRSNREIAQALFLSEHTVARHLTHIFTKTGVENRAGAATYALRHDLA